MIPFKSNIFIFGILIFPNDAVFHGTVTWCGYYKNNEIYFDLNKTTKSFGLDSFITLIALSRIIGIRSVQKSWDCWNWGWSQFNEKQGIGISPKVLCMWWLWSFQNINNSKFPEISKKQFWNRSPNIWRKKSLGQVLVLPYLNESKFWLVYDHH